MSRYAEEEYKGAAFEDFLNTRFTKISNSGTQNCGVYTPNEEFYKENKHLPSPLILICNHTKLEDTKKQFLLENTDIYVELYREYKITELTENQKNTKNSYLSGQRNENTELYYYLWQKMDGDVRQLFSKDIPSRFLKNNVEMELFTTLSNEESIPLFVIYNPPEPENEKLLPDSLFKEVTFLGPSGHHPLTLFKELNTDLKELPFNWNHGKLTWYCLKRQHDLFERKADLWRRVLLYLEKSSDDKRLFRESLVFEFESIMSSIEYAMTQFIEQVSKLESNMHKVGWSFGDKKFDNVVYKHDNGKYTFRFIDPDSTLHSNRSINFETNLLERIENKYQHFQYHNAKTNLFQSNFLSAMFTLIDIDGAWMLRDKNNTLNIDDFFGNWALTDFKPNIMNVLPFVHRLKNADILDLIGHSKDDANGQTKKTRWFRCLWKGGGKSITRKIGHKKRSTRQLLIKLDKT
jgi:hypothetical protein